MGAWGTAIFSDDTACDVRDDYRDLLGDGHQAEEATDRLLTEWGDSLEDPDEGPVVWLALALTQWKLGRLEPRVAEKAIEAIDSGRDLKKWEGADREKRQKVLEKVREQLVSPQPPPKRVPKRFRNSCDWGVGELIAYTTLSKEKILFRVIGHHEDKGGRSPVCELLKWKGTDIPGKWRLRVLGIWKKRYESGHTVSQFLLGRTSDRELPRERIERLGIKTLPRQRPQGYTVWLWRYLDRLLKEHFDIE